MSGDNSIIKVVQRFSPFFRMYQQYVAGYQESLRILTEVRKDKTLANLLAKGYDSCQVEICSLLIEPVQRIPRYKMLMEEMLHNIIWSSTGAKHTDFLLNFLAVCDSA